MSKKITITIVILIALVALGWVIFSSEMLKDLNRSQGISLSVEDLESNKPVAIVNNQEISAQDFRQLRSQIADQQGVDINSLDEQTKKQFERQVLDALISQELIKQEAQESNVAIDIQLIDQQIESFKQQFPNPEEFQSALTAQGLTEEQLRNSISDNLLTQNYLSQQLSFSEITATSEEIESLYQQISESGQEVPALETVYGQVEQSVIAQKQQELIEELVKELREESNIEILI